MSSLLNSIQVVYFVTAEATTNTLTFHNVPEFSPTNVKFWLFHVGGHLDKWRCPDYMGWLGSAQDAHVWKEPYLWETKKNWTSHTPIPHPHELLGFHWLHNGWIWPCRPDIADLLKLNCGLDTVNHIMTRESVSKAVRAHFVVDAALNVTLLRRIIPRLKPDELNMNSQALTRAITVVKVYLLTRIVSHLPPGAGKWWPACWRWKLNTPPY